jgi:hypothetical protein
MAVANHRWGTWGLSVNKHTALANTSKPIQQFQVGDLVRIRGTKDVGRVVDETCYSHTVCVFGETNRKEDFTPDCLEMWTPAPRRQFKFGDVRIIGTRFNGRIGLIIEDNGNEEEDRPYRVALYGDHTDENFSASELISWVPEVGDWVTEMEGRGEEVGIIRENDGKTSHVQWRTLKDAPYWPNIRLEPGNELPTARQ